LRKIFTAIFHPQISAPPAAEGNGSNTLPFLARYSRLPQNPNQQAAADIVTVRVRNPQLDVPALHLLVVAAGNRWLEAQGAKTGDKLL
jgi:hypothetical protein